MNFKKNLMALILVLFVLQGCDVDYRDNPNCEYLSFEELREKSIEVLPAKEIEKAGKIYVYKNLLLVQEANQGIHIIDNRDKNNPIPKVFLKILGNIDIAVKEGYLYADSYIDLLVIDINDLEKIKEVNRSKNAFSYEPIYNYDCGEYDSSKGIIVQRGAR